MQATILGKNVILSIHIPVGEIHLHPETFSQLQSQVTDISYRDESKKEVSR